MHGARAAFEQRQKNHQLKQVVKCREVQTLQQEIRRQGLGADLRVEGDHAHEKEQRRKHGERAGKDASNHRVLPARQVAQYREDHHGADDVVAGVGESAQDPAIVRRGGCQAGQDTVTEREERQQHENRVHGIEEN